MMEEKPISLQRNSDLRTKTGKNNKKLPLPKILETANTFCETKRWCTFFYYHNITFHTERGFIALTQAKKRTRN